MSCRLKTEHGGRLPLWEERGALGEGETLLCPPLPLLQEPEILDPEAHPDRGERKCTELGSTQMGQAPPTPGPPALPGSAVGSGSPKGDRYLLFPPTRSIAPFI